MLTSSYANNFTFFYPLGNTPAVSLTQNLPPDKQANVLLLGSGDVRHVLFTVHNDHRQIDITCCDVEKAIIARNVLLLSLLIDGVEKSKLILCWNIYYHFRIDKPTFLLLQDQARKLCSLSASLQSWHESRYAKIIRVCDSGSLAKMKDMWTFYGGKEEGKESSSRFENQYEAYILKSRRDRAHLGINVNLTGMRSAAPTQMRALADLDTSHKHYWEHGSTDVDEKTLALAVYANPMFMTPEKNVALHYGTDPLMGFHLATAYAPLTSESPLFRASKEVKSTEVLVEGAKIEFFAWASSFRKYSHLVIIRLFIGDALSFSHTLQHIRNPGASLPVHFYRDRFHFTSLILDGEDYSNNGNAPLMFTTIDTSNLIDHVGTLNLLAATVPLLSNDLSATLYTEKLTQSDDTFSKLFDNLLCGPLTTVSMLLGIIPMDLMTNTSSLSSGDEMLLNAVTRASGKGSRNSGQLFTRIAWKQPVRINPVLCTDDVQNIVTIDPRILAKVLYHIYLKMFENEDVSGMLSNSTMLKLRKFSLPNQQRASFVAFICIIKQRINVDWQETIDFLLEHLRFNTTHLMTNNYIQEFYTWLHLLGIYSVDTFKMPVGHSVADSSAKDLCDWSDIPSVVSVTLVVPRERLKVFTDGDLIKNRTPPVHCLVQGSSNGDQWQNIFSAIQIGFGKVETVGVRFSDSYRVNVVDDESSWSGTSPLVVSFYAPTWMLLQQSMTTSIGFGIQSTPQTVSAFISSLGLDLLIYQTALSDTSGVFISKTLPNQDPMIIRSTTIKDSSLTGLDEMVATSSTTVTIDPDTIKVTSLISRIDVLSDSCKAALLAGSQVVVTAVTPYNFTTTLQPACIFRANFPVAVLERSLKRRIARRSSYIELILQAANEDEWHTFSSFLYPVFSSSGIIAAWNMPYLSLEMMPILDTRQSSRLDWLTTHTSFMFSARERVLRESPSLQASVGERTRSEFKDSLFTMFMNYSGVQGRKAQVFGLDCPTDDGVHVLIFISALRLDLSNRTVVLDAAVMPLTLALVSQIAPFLQKLTISGGVCMIKTTGAEMRVWKEAIPAYVERCRTWSHKPDCQYSTQGKIPLSVEKGERLLCACGEGIFPERFMTNLPSWNMMKRHSIRAAISPCFSAAMFETGLELGQELGSSDIEGQSQRLDLCQVCGRNKRPDGSGLLNCARCHQVRYCSQECQRTDWKIHKRICKTS